LEPPPLQQTTPQIIQPTTASPFADLNRETRPLRRQHDRAGEEEDDTRSPGFGIASFCCGTVGAFFALPLLLGLLHVRLPIGAALVFGVAAVFLAFLVVPVLLLAVIFGVIGIWRTNGQVMAFLGFALGSIGLVTEFFFWLSTAGR
jgi:uncharacterized membrane protein